MFNVNGRSVTAYGGKRKSEAREKLEAIRRKIHRQEVLGEHAVQELPFEKLAIEYLHATAREHTPGTHVTYGRYVDGWISPAFKGMIASKLQPTDFDRFLSRLDVSGPTRNRIRGICSSVMSYAVRTGRARANPVLKTRRIREEQRAVPVLDFEEQRKLVDAVEEELRPLVRLALGSGLRLGEMLRLRWADLDLARGALTVRVAKSKKPRVVYLPADVRTMLEDLHEARVFDWLPAGNQTFQGKFRRRWRRAMVDLGHPGFRLHDCRHVFAVSMVRAGVPLSDVSKILGHSTIQMTMRYAAHAPADYGERARSLLESASARATARATNSGAEGSAG